MNTDPRRAIDVAFKESDLEELKIFKEMMGVSFSKIASRTMRLGIKTLKEMPAIEAVELMNKKGEL